MLRQFLQPVGFSRAILLIASVLAGSGMHLRAQDVQLGPPPKASFPALDSAAEIAAPQSGASSPAWLNPWSRALIRNSYQTVLLPSQDNISVGWTGNGASCVAGTTAQPYRDAVALRLNWFRLVAGVPPWILLDSVNNAKDQQAALMMSVNRAVNHNPPGSWQCYTADGAEAAGHSNLCYSTGASYLPGDPGCVQSYMNDFGPGNGATGHRRWLLYPQTQSMGTGDVPATGTYYSANALWSYDSNYGGSRPATRDGFVAWPPRGYIPAPLVFGRWSFSYPGASFDSAAVAMRCNGAVLPLTQLTPANGYGENTLVWEPAACTPPAGMDAVAEVSVSNVVVGGGPQDFTYTVRIFNPSTAVTERIGVYRLGQWQLDADGDGVFNAGVDKSFNWGWSETTPVHGDWNGDGKQEAGLYIGGVWYLDYNGDGAWDNGVVDKVYGFGMAGAEPKIGDWNGDGKDEIGIYINGFWFLDMNGNGIWDGEPTDKMIIWGFVGSTPVTGDWNGDRQDEGRFVQGRLMVPGCGRQRDLGRRHDG